MQYTHGHMQKKPKRDVLAEKERKAGSSKACLGWKEQVRRFTACMPNLVEL